MYIKSPDIIENEIENEIIIFDNKNKKYYMLNEIATIIWKKIFDISETKILAEYIYNLIDNKVNLNIKNIEDDVQSTIDTFIKNKLLLKEKNELLNISSENN